MKINKLRNRAAHNERLFNPGPDGYSSMGIDSDLLYLFRALSPEAHESIYGNDKKTTVEKFLEDCPAPIDIEL